MMENFELIDSHAHLDGEEYSEDIGEVLARARDAGVVGIISFGDAAESSGRAVSLAAEYEEIFAGVGVHPENIFEMTDDDFDRIAKWTKEPGVVAIGEIGLDYYWEKDENRRDLQRRMLIRELSLARELDLPVCIHDREAHGDMMTILRTEGRKNRGVIHCFSGSAEMATELISLGWYLGFDGPVTYKNAVKFYNILREIPAERILVETDCPYLSPVPHRGERNEPAFVSLTARRAAEIRGESFEKFAVQTTKNAREIYGLKKQI